MTENYREYLAARLLTESRPVTYRLLSREIKVNVNTAKHMLYEFYTKQNVKKPRSVHATYLITGRKPTSEHTNGVNGSGLDGSGDSYMQSSHPMSSIPETEASDRPVPKTTIALVREEELEKTRKDFEEITSEHIYSLEPGPIENLNLLSVCSQEVVIAQTEDDPLERWRLYGSIHNPYVKRRTTKFAPPSAPATKPALNVAAKLSAAATSKEKDKSVPERRGSASDANTSGRSTPQPTAGSSTLKKSDSKSNSIRDKSGIFKSFAKTKPPKPKEADKSKEPTPVSVEDDPMQGMSEDEGDVDQTPEVEIDTAKETEARKARTERAEKLRKMMDDDDDDMLDAPPTEEEDSQESEKAAPNKTSEEDAAVTTQNGRRRGRRRVTKKKTVKDEDGYLVTKEEQVWESFSEDEPQPKKAKPTPKPTASTAKGKMAGKKGQGSIASFFKKT